MEKNEGEISPTNKWGIDKEATFGKQWDFLMQQFEKESDRAAVILVVSIIDENLRTLLISFLAPCPSSHDPLFDSATSALSTFSSKIDLAFRLGLISSKLCRDIHIFRKIRNSFAHDIYGCDFENGAVISRIRELENSVHNSNFELSIKAGLEEIMYKGIRGKFIFIAAMILWTLNSCIKKNHSLIVLKEEWLYNDILTYQRPNDDS